MNITRRDALKRGGGAVALGGTIALGVAAEAAPETETEPIAWTIPDDKFSCLFFCKGDELLLSPVTEPMREMGMYAVSTGDGFELLWVMLGAAQDGKPSPRASARGAMGDFDHVEAYDRLAADAPKGHRILWHAPTFGAAAADGGRHG